MINRYQKSVPMVEVPKVSAGMFAATMSSYTDKDGNHAVIPADWTVSGEKTEQTIWKIDQGLVIYHIPKWRVSAIDWNNPQEVEWLKRTYDQFVYVPVSMLESNGELDFTADKTHKKFGRRISIGAQAYSKGYRDPITQELLRQYLAVQMYGGFFFSRYNIGQDRFGRMRSVKGIMPCTLGDLNTKRKLASKLKVGTVNTSHLMYGAEYDTMREWVLETKTQSYQQLAECDIKGNRLWDESSPKGMSETGSREDWKICNIYDLDGNVCECTQEERYGKRIVRGIRHDDWGRMHALIRRELSSNSEEHGVGFRTALSIKI